jgi:hypothetical protein
VKEAKGWRIDDIVFEDDTTLRQGLNADIRDFRLAKAKAGQ